MQGIRKPISEIWKVLKSRTEGLLLNALSRTFGIAKNTLLDWEQKFTSLYHTLLIYPMAQTFVQLII